jgi:primosomal protein N' (replication factor Y)
MQYAVVAVNTKTSLVNQLFTYKINPEHLPYIRPGIFVKVPFNRKMTDGFVMSLTSNVDKSFKLKSITKIIDKNPILTLDQIELAKNISDYYLSPIGKVLSMMIPDSATRLSSKINIDSSKQTATRNNTGKTYTIYDRLDNRIENYSKLIIKTLGKNKSALVILPSKDIANYFIHKTSTIINKKHLGVLYGNQTKTEKYQTWINILTGKIKIVVGTRSAIFAPIQNLGLIIIDEPENFGYKEEQSPTYNALEILKMIVSGSEANLIIGGIYPDLNANFNLKKQNYKVITKPKIIDHLAKIQTTVLNMKNERSLISSSLENEIKNSLEKKERVFLFVNKKGGGKVVTCNDCNTVLKCPRCDLPYYALSDINDVLLCSHCNSKINIPSNCATCSGTNLVKRGIGTLTVKRIIKKLFPKAKVLIIEKNEKNNVDFSLFNEFDIVIGTQKIFSFNDQFNLTAVVNIDSSLNIPDYKTSENIFLTLVKLASITTEKLFIQSFFEENYILNNIKHPNDICDYLINERKSHNYPPFSTLIKLTIKNRLEKICIFEAEKMQKNLTQAGINFLGPNPCFIAKKRDKYYYQIVIKTDSYTKKFRDKIIKIKGLGKWQIDVNPISLL